MTQTQRPGVDWPTLLYGVGYYVRVYDKYNIPPQSEWPQGATSCERWPDGSLRWELDGDTVLVLT